MSTITGPVATIRHLDPSPEVGITAGALSGRPSRVLFLCHEELEVLTDLLDEMQLVARCTAAFSAISMPGSRRRKAFVALRDKVELLQCGVTDDEEEDDDDTV